MYTISAAGQVRQVGNYSDGRADELAIAPTEFGSVGGDALLTLEGDADTGALVTMDAGSRTRTLATISDGLNPIPAATPTPTKRRELRRPACTSPTDINPVRLLHARRPTRRLRRGRDRGQSEQGSVLDRRATRTWLRRDPGAPQRDPGRRLLRHTSGRLALPIRKAPAAPVARRLRLAHGACGCGPAAPRLGTPFRRLMRSGVGTDAAWGACECQRTRVTEPSW